MKKIMSMWSPHPAGFKIFFLSPYTKNLISFIWVFSLVFVENSVGKSELN